MGDGTNAGVNSYYVRVRGSDPSLGLTTEWSGSSTPVVVDKTAPAQPSVAADRAPDYAGGGGWYKDTVDVSFTDNGDSALADGSPGSGVDPSLIPSLQTFATDGSHEASATARDNVGNEAAPVSLTVQLDASAPSLEVSCPAEVLIGTSGVKATVTASDGQSGLASDPSGTAAISTSTVGPKTVERTAVDNVGHSTSASCTTQVVHSLVITGNVKRKLVVKSGQAVELAPSATTKAVEVQPGGSLDVEGASTKAIKASGATLIRICGATVSGAVLITGSTGPVVIGEATEGCSSSNITKLTLQGNTGGVLVDENTIKGNLKVTGGEGGTTVTNNTVNKNLTVTGNSGEVSDKPNSVKGKTRVQ